MIRFNLIGVHSVHHDPRNINISTEEKGTILLESI